MLFIFYYLYAKYPNPALKQHITTLTLCLLLLAVAAGCSRLDHDQDETGDLSQRGWMASLDDGSRICCLAIPGTHDSFTYNAPAVTARWAQTQVLDITDQWAAGIRSFDIRVDAGSLNLCHSSVNLRISLADALGLINRQLRENRSECAIIIIRIERGRETDEAKEKINNAILGSFDAVASWRPGLTLGEARGKAIVIYRYALPAGVEPLGPSASGFGNNDHSQRLTLASGGSVLSAEFWVQDCYSPDGGSNDDFWKRKQSLMSDNFNYMRALAREGNPDNAWAVNHASAYAGSGITMNYPRNASTMNAWTLQWYLPSDCRFPGIIPMDFAGVNVSLNGWRTAGSYLPEAIIANNRIKIQ